MEFDDVADIFISALKAVSAGAASNLIGEVTDPILIASFQVSTSYGALGVILAFIVLIRLVIQDTKEYLAMGVYAFIALLVLLLPLGWAITLMFLSWGCLALLHEKVEF
jgi:uncharacterized protein YaaW (UPF0174 family)